MRLLVFVALALPSILGCHQTYHPEYAPITATKYTNTVHSPIVVQPSNGQPVHVVPAQVVPAQVVPAQGHTTVFPAPPHPPTPPPGFPWGE